MTKLRLAFLGTPVFAATILEALLRAGHDIACVYCQPARPAGRRGLQLQPSPVQELAERKGLKVETPSRLGADEAARLASLKLDAAVVAAYGLILPKPILAAPRLGCVNVHASLLPRWRGAAPIDHVRRAAARRAAEAPLPFPAASLTRKALDTSLIAEAMAQVGGILALMSLPEHLGNSHLFLLGLDKMRFRQPVVPGDQLRIEVESVRGGKKFWKMKAQAFVNQFTYLLNIYRFIGKPNYVSVATHKINTVIKALCSHRD